MAAVSGWGCLAATAAVVVGWVGGGAGWAQAALVDLAASGRLACYGPGRALGPRPAQLPQAPAPPRPHAACCQHADVPTLTKPCKVVFENLLEFEGCWADWIGLGYSWNVTGRDWAGPADCFMSPDIEIDVDPDIGVTIIVNESDPGNNYPGEASAPTAAPAAAPSSPVVAPAPAPAPSPSPAANSTNNTDSGGKPWLAVARVGNRALDHVCAQPGGSARAGQAAARERA